MRANVCLCTINLPTLFASICLLFASSVYAQISPDSLNSTKPLDSLTLSREAFAKTSNDTTGLDSLASELEAVQAPKIYQVSKDGLSDKVAYKMRDSMHYSIADKTIRMYGDATVEYTDLTLGAGVLTINYETSILEAFPVEDSLGKLIERPSFEQGAQAFEAKGMRYNFKTRKGIITNATTQQGDLYVLGGKTKLVAAAPGDPARLDNTVYNSDAIITTCNLEHPHYGIRSNKQKVIPGKQVIVGPSNVELGGVPTPLWLPFGFFPIGSSERSGLLFPKDYTYTPVDGFGFQQIGWYFPWNDNIHSEVTTDIFLKGTVRLNTNTNYRKRYRYDGNFSLGANRQRTESNLDGLITYAPSYALIWRHNQDPKANPYRTIRADINFTTNDYVRRVGLSYESQLTNTFRSNASVAFRFPSHPSWNLTLGANHSQNTRTNEVNISFPAARFSTGAMSPFKNVAGPSTAWYKKAVVTYTAQFRGDVTATDTTLFDAEPWEDARLGGTHNVAFNAPINVLKYFRLTPSISANQTLYFDEFSRYYNSRTIQDSVPVVVGNDTIDYNVTLREVGAARDTFMRGINTANSFQASVGLTTNVYGTARFKVGAVQGLRHIMMPSVSMGFTPDYSAPIFGYYDSVQVSPDGRKQQYLRFASQPFGPGSLPNSLALRMNYSLNNRLESKIQSKSDSTSKIVTLLNNMTVSGNYNFAADSFRWSDVTVSGAQLTLFKNILRLNVGGGRFGVYERSADGLRNIDTTLLASGKFPLRFDAVRMDLGVQLTMGQLREIVTGEKVTTSNKEIYSLIDRFRISYNFSRAYNRFRQGTDMLWQTTANSINASGSIPLTEKWSIRTLTIGYDLSSQRITYPSLSIGRDLHCWEMDFFWAPTLGSFNFSIRVKPSSLGFLEVPYRRGNRF